MLNEEESESKRTKSKEYFAKRLAEFDDDEEKAKGDEEFFKDR
jgi:hypothetical protein